MASIEGLDPSGDFAVYEILSNILEKKKYHDASEILLKAKEFKIFTISKIENGFAPIGLIDKYNPGGVFKKISHENNKINMSVKFGGNFRFYCENKPVRILVDAKEITFDFNAEKYFLKIKTEEIENQNIEIIL